MKSAGGGEKRPYVKEYMSHMLHQRRKEKTAATKARMSERQLEGKLINTEQVKSEWENEIQTSDSKPKDKSSTWSKIQKHNNLSLQKNRGSLHNNLFYSSP